MSPNFTLLDMSRPEVATVVAAMVQARDAVGRRSWSHPQEPTGEAWWADVLADPRARRHALHDRHRKIKHPFYRLKDEPARDHPRCLQQVRLDGSVQPR